MSVTGVAKRNLLTLPCMSVYPCITIWEPQNWFLENSCLWIFTKFDHKFQFWLKLENNGTSYKKFLRSKGTWWRIPKLGIPMKILNYAGNPRITTIQADQHHTHTKVTDPRQLKCHLWYAHNSHFVCVCVYMRARAFVRITRFYLKKLDFII